MISLHQKFKWLIGVAVLAMIAAGNHFSKIIVQKKDILKHDNGTHSLFNQTKQS